jgi:GntR family transcriptional regulator/MocR family aminotransferase
MTVARTLLDGHSAPLAQMTLARFMEGGHFGAHVRAMRGIYAERLGLLAGLVDKHLAGVAEAQVPAGGLQMPCLLKPGLPERAAIDAARHAGIALLGLSSLYAAGDGKPGFLMGFAAYTPSEIEAAVGKLATALQAAKH